MDENWLLARLGEGYRAGDITTTFNDFRIQDSGNPKAV